MKKTIILISAITLTALTGSVASESLRAGLIIGGASHRASVKTILGTAKDKLTTSSPAVGVFFGVDCKISESPLFVGMEFSLINHNAEEEQYLTTHGITATSFKLKTNNSFKQMLRFGFVANEAENDILLYGKAGLASTNWETTVTDQLVYKNQFQKYGLVAGIGMESKVNKSFSIAWEHEFTFNSEMRRLHPELELKTKPLVQTTSMRLTYSF